MTNEVWINLPVKDINRSRAFFSDIGFTIDLNAGNPSISVTLLLGAKKVVVMLFEENVFRSFTGHPLTDTGKSSEVMISFDAESREEIDEIAAKVSAAGGTLFGKPADIQGWMYGFGFTDPDGHRWNGLHMDMSKMPKH